MLIAVALNAVLFATVLGTLTVGYESNDDVGMAAIASGLMTGKPSAELIYTNIGIGLCLKQLYLWTNRVNWYSVYLLVVHFAAMSGLLFVFLRIRPSLLSIVLFCLLFFGYEVALLLWLQFTSAAIIAGIVGSLLLTSVGGESGRTWPTTGYGGLLIILAGLMRADALPYGLVVVAPFLVERLIRLRRWRPVLSMGAFVAIALAAPSLTSGTTAAIRVGRASTLFGPCGGLSSTRKASTTTQAHVHFSTAWVGARPTGA